MILRLFGLLFGAAALVIGLFGGWGWPFGDMVSRVNHRGLAGLQDSASAILWSGAWDSLIDPVLRMPAWSIPTIIALVLFLIAAMQPAKA